MKSILNYVSTVKKSFGDWRAARGDDDGFASIVFSATAALLARVLADYPSDYSNNTIDELILDLKGCLRTRDLSYDDTTQSLFTSLLNGEWTQQTRETLWDVTAGGTGTFTEYIDMTGRKHFGLQCDLDGNETITIHGSMEWDVAAASAKYEDITNLLFGVATITADGVFVDDAGKAANFRWLKVQNVVSATGTYVVWASEIY